MTAKAKALKSKSSVNSYKAVPDLQRYDESGNSSSSETRLQYAEEEAIARETTHIHSPNSGTESGMRRKREAMDERVWKE